MTAFPVTTRTQYLTGQTALNIPTKTNDFADWHFSEVFLSGRGRLHIAGQDLPSTDDVLGDYGIHECSDVLRRYGVPLAESFTVYAGNYVRSILDMVLYSIRNGTLPHHVTVDDMLDYAADKSELVEQVQQLTTRLTDRHQIALLTEWRALYCPAL
jgi:hypothetical protein